MSPDVFPSISCAHLLAKRPVDCQTIIVPGRGHSDRRETDAFRVDARGDVVMDADVKPS
jgi:hypothetical protein